MLPIFPYINFHTHFPSNDDGVISVLNIDLGKNESWQAEFKTCSIGIHPWHINKNDLIAQFFKLEDACKQANVFAVGEAGLDKLIETPLTLQTRVLEQQIEIANFYGKPMIIHCVGAYYELIALRKKLKSIIPFVIHGYHKNAQVLQDLINNDFYISLGSAMFQPASKLGHIPALVPYNKLFLETDDKMTPIQGIYIAAAEKLGLEIDSLKLIINENYNRICNIS